MTIQNVMIAEPLNQAGQSGGFGQCQQTHVLAEIGLRRLSKTVNAEGAAPAEVDLVGVVFEDLFLGEFLLDLQCDHHLGEFALPVLVGIEP